MKFFVCLLFCISWATCLMPPVFQWNVLKFIKDPKSPESEIGIKDYVPENNIPTGIARWKKRVFITIPKWKSKGIPISLAYVNIGDSTQLLYPYPTWHDAYLPDFATDITTNATIVSAFRMHVDECDRLWVPDNGVSDMATVNSMTQLTDPAIVLFDLNNDTLIDRFILPSEVLRESSMMSSVVVDIGNDKTVACRDRNTHAYIADMGANAIIVFSLKNNEAWRVEHPYFSFDPLAGVYNVGNIKFYWKDGVSSLALSRVKRDGFRDVYLYPTSSTKQFKISTKLLKAQEINDDELFVGVKILGERGKSSQSTACAYDPKTMVLFYTQLSKNGISCWNTKTRLTKETSPCIIKDCYAMEFPNDIQVDYEGNIWILSNRLARFLYGKMFYDEVNFRVLSAPVSQVIKGTPCDINYLNKEQRKENKEKIEL